MIKLTFIGDIMCQKELLTVYKDKEGYDFSEIFEGTKEFFEESNIVIGNLETPISRNLSEFTKQQYSFSSPYEFAEAVYKSGIKCVSTANNHCLDRGIKGLEKTLEYLDDIGLLHTGTYKTKNKEPLIIELNDIKIGILSYTYGTNAFSNKNYLKRNNKYHVNLFQNQELSNPITRYFYFNGNNIIARIYNKIVRIMFGEKVYERKQSDFFCKKRLIKDIKNIKQSETDIIIMCMHAGGQYNENPLKRTKKLSKFLLKYGVNIVVGNHEHVVHGGKFDKISKNKLITYSLGNYCTIYGLYKEPFDKMANYSIAWNVYIENNNEKVEICKTTFTVLKTIKTKKQGIKTVLLYDLINEEKDIKEKEKMIEDIKKIAYKFSNIKYNEVLKEYEIKNEV